MGRGMGFSNVALFTFTACYRNPSSPRTGARACKRRPFHRRAGCPRIPCSTPLKGSESQVGPGRRHANRHSPIPIPANPSCPKASHSTDPDSAGATTPATRAASSVIVEDWQDATMPRISGNRSSTSSVAAGVPTDMPKRIEEQRHHRPRQGGRQEQVVEGIAGGRTHHQAEADASSWRDTEMRPASRLTASAPKKMPPTDGTNCHPNCSAPRPR